MTLLHIGWRGKLRECYLNTVEAELQFWELLPKINTILLDYILMLKSALLHEFRLRVRYYILLPS